MSRRKHTVPPDTRARETSLGIGWEPLGELLYLEDLLGLPKPEYYPPE